MGNQLPQSVLILLFLLLPGDASATAEPQYLVLVPSHLYTGVPEKACVILNHLNETVALKVTLKYEMQNNPLFTDLVMKRNYFYCSSFMIPELPSSWVVIAVEVKGATLHFTKRKSIHITTAENLVFVQTDKSIYKPGQTVKFRVVSMDVNFHPLDEMFPVVYIEDPMKNRIFQRQSLKLQGGLIQLSFPLSVEPILGSYKIMLQKESGKKIERSFEVNEYVLPKFEVQVKMPKVIGFLDEEFVVTTCALYTYGEPVPGMVTLSVCRKYLLYCFGCHNTHSQSICEEFSQQTDTEGCFTQLVKTKIFQLRRKGYDMTIHVEAKVKEKGTGLELTGHGSCEITNTLSILRFTKVDSHYRSGLPWYGQVLLVNGNHQPITNKTVDVHVNTRYYFSATTDERGLVNISMDTTNYVSPFLTVSVKYKESNNSFDNWWLAEFHKQTSHTAKHFFSPSKSYIHLKPTIGTLTCGQTQEIQVHYILNEEILKDEKELTFYYLIKARGKISQSGIHVLSIEQGNMKGVFSFSFRVESDSAPRAHLLVYTVLPNGEIVADADKLEIENCFANKVTLRFSSAQSLPASNTHLKVTATPLSLCALRAVDQSVLLMKPEAELSPQSVYNLLPVKSPFTFRVGGPADEYDEKCNIAKDTTHRGITSTPKQVLEGDDIYRTFMAIGLDIFTNSKIHKPPLCLPRRLRASIIGGPGLRGLPLGEIMYPMVGEETQILQVEEIVRKYFPETWIWDLVAVDSSGVRDLVMQVPDTITEWKASAFCLSGTTGFGLSPVVSLQAFQPFFLELTLPYSVVRGEAFTLKATVFNYLSICIRVIVQLEVSSAFLAVPTEKNEESHCVCRNGRKTVSWTVTPKSLGKVNFTATAEAVHSQQVCDNELTDVPPLVQKDTVVKPLLVERNMIHNFPSFICVCLLPLDTGVPEKVSLNVPSNVVEGSPRATYSVLGDILGSVVQNLQNLLQMPYGCGEQNMVLFVPNIYVLNYLNETRQLTEKIKAKATSYLISGYQRQLNYKHRDGSYSTFGDNDGSSQGNTWLTAFVLKSFAQAQSYIFVENSHIRDALTWLSRRQKADGCFEGSGSLLNNAIKGGVNDELTLSAYITIALLEMPLPATHAVVRSALSCLETAWSSTSEDQGSLVYTKALLAYAFALAGNKVKRRELLESLNREAVKEEDSIHWQRPGKLQEAKTLYSQPRAPSAEVEMTSYVLLTYLTVQPAPSSEDLSMASRIVKWITKQQNPQGGFSSTQDTVVALQALSKYGTATFSKSEKAALVTVKSSHTFSKDFQVDDGNRLVLQEVRLPEVPGEYSTTVSGSGCAYLQTCLRYNILPKKEGKAPFALQVNTLPTNCDEVDAHRKFQIHINISYTGDRPSSNMVIVDVKMVSGFIPMKPSVKQLQKQPQIQRTEVSMNHVLIYFEKLTHQTLNFSFFVEQDIQIKNLKPATVKAYDYYETDEFTFEEYSAPCSSGKVLMIQSNAN
ncbi:PREDICTED: pregnancy zone protein-like [Rhinopithecus bieti]|uniref:pregnancy zone protein-like n=1 Tax=Rhinopithecus bieti TaxID=61621 RepID=UPI00083BDFA7|nr:PREDICTED: pregnancy zone protein-like [Rhinopithecus bieti]